MELNRNEVNLLLYVETCLVDSRGNIESARMNEADWKIMDDWKEKALIDFGRRPFNDIRNRPVGTTAKTHWVRFTVQAWQLAHKCRRERAERYVVNLEESQ